MKALFALISSACFAMSLYSQSTPAEVPTSPPERVHELGLLLSGFDGFGLTYRIGKPHALWTIDGFDLNVSGAMFSTPGLPGRALNSRMRIVVGREYRKDISKQLQFRAGFNLGIGGTFNRTSSVPLPQDYLDIRPEVGALLGANYVIKDRIVIGAQVGPYLYYEYEQRNSWNSVPDSHRIGLSLANSAANS